MSRIASSRNHPLLRRLLRRLLRAFLPLPRAQSAFPQPMKRRHPRICCPTALSAGGWVRRAVLPAATRLRRSRTTTPIAAVSLVRACDRSRVLRRFQRGTTVHVRLYGSSRRRRRQPIASLSLRALKNSQAVILPMEAGDGMLRALWIRSLFDLPDARSSHVVAAALLAGAAGAGGDVRPGAEVALARVVGGGDVVGDGGDSGGLGGEDGAVGSFVLQAGPVLWVDGVSVFGFFWGIGVLRTCAELTGTGAASCYCALWDRAR